jgi:hypothetical protein
LVRLATTRGTNQDDARARRPWMERHPVLTGMIVGFGAGVGLTYLAAADQREEFLTPISTGSVALFWGGVGAGVGTLAGWGFGRNR